MNPFKIASPTETTTITFKMTDGMDVTMPVACNSCRFLKSDTIPPELDHESVQSIPSQTCTKIIRDGVELFTVWLSTPGHCFFHDDGGTTIVIGSGWESTVQVMFKEDVGDGVTLHMNNYTPKEKIIEIEVVEMRNVEAFRREFVPACSDDVQPDMVVEKE